MKINGNQIRPGNVIEHKSRLWVAVKTQHTQPGKGGAYAQVELKDLREGTKLNERFRASESVDLVRLDEEDYQFLFLEDQTLNLMHAENYEQITAQIEMVGEAARFLKDGMTVSVCSYEGEIVSISLPDHMVFEIAEADAVVKGQTASSSFKPAVLENGVRILVPPHINAGTRVLINTVDGTYIERAKD